MKFFAKFRRILWFDTCIFLSLLALLYVLFFLPTTLPKKILSFWVELVLLFVVFVIGIQHCRDRLRADSFLIPLFSGFRINQAHLTVFVFIFFSFLLGYGSYLRHQVFQSSFDFAIFAQAIWNTWKGNFLYSSIKGGICLLGDHVSPLLIIFAPLYGIWGDPTVLLVAQAVIAASAVFPLYLIGKEVLKDKTLAFIFIIAYAVYAPLRGAVRFDFHPEILGEPLILWAFFFFLRNRLISATIFLTGVLFTKETACMPLAMFGFYAFWFKNKRIFGAAWMLVSVIYFLIAVYWISPYFSGESYFYLKKYVVWQQKGIIALLAHLFQPSTFNYFFRVFLPLGCFSFLSPSTAILAMPVFFQNLITPGEFTRSIYFHYSSLLTSFVFISAIYGTNNFILYFGRAGKPHSERARKFVIYWILVWSIIYSGKADIHIIREYAKQDTAHFTYIRNYLKTIPSNVSVRTHEFFAPHVAMRKDLHIYENENSREGASQKAKNTDYVILDRIFLGDDADKKLSEVKQNGYALIHENGGFFVLQRRNLN